MEIMKIAGLALLGVFTATLLKHGKGEYSTIIGLVMALFVCSYVISNLLTVVSSVETLWSRIAGRSDVLKILLRMIGITYISELSAGICKESGYQVLSNQVTLAGKIGILLAGFPILLELLEFVTNLGGSS